MNFRYRVFYEDDSRFSFGQIRFKQIRARSPEKAMKRFEEKYGIKPLWAE